MDKKDLIFEAVLEIALQGGLSATPMSKIANQAGIAAGTIYRYFESKEVLLSQLYSGIADELYLVMAKLHDESLPLKECIFQMWKGIIEYYLSNSNKVKFMHEYRLSYQTSSEVLCKQKEVYALFTDVLHRGVASNIIRPISCAVMSSFVLGPITELYTYHESGITIVDENTIKEAFNVLWQGISM
jgi:AcrR family transcriptional regulator